MTKGEQALSKSGNLEIEVKLKIANLNEMRRLVLSLGLEEKVNRAFEENWILDFPQKRLRQRGCLLRLRHYNGRSYVTFKSPSTQASNLKIRKELETEVSDHAILFQILQRLGLVQIFRYQKYRSIFEPKSPRSRARVILTLDETPIGNYMEIEGPPKHIEKIASQLGFSKKEFIKESYLALFARIHNSSLPGEMVFPPDK